MIFNAALFGLEDGAVVLFDRTVIISALHLDDLEHIFICWTFPLVICADLLERGIEMQWFSWI